MSEKMFLSTGDPEKDAKIAQGIRRHDHLEDEGMCPNGCAPIIWDDPHNRSCPKCGFHGWSNTPYNGGTAPE